MPNRNSRRNGRALAHQIHPPAHGANEQAQQQRQQERQHHQVNQLDHLFRDLEVAANLDPNNTLPSRTPRQQNDPPGASSTNGTLQTNENRTLQFGAPQDARLVPATPLVQPRSNNYQASTTGDSDQHQLPIIDRLRPLPRNSRATQDLDHAFPSQNPSRPSPETRSPSVQRVQQLPLTPARSTSPTLDRVHELRRTGYSSANPTQPPSHNMSRTSNDGNKGADWMEINPPIEVSRGLMDSTLSGRNPSSGRQAEVESSVHLPLACSVGGDEIVVVEREVIGGEDGFQVVETVRESEHNESRRVWWRGYRRS